MIENAMTTGAVVYRDKDGKIEFLAILQTKEKAEENIALLERCGQTGWKCSVVIFLGWGQVAPGVFSQNGPPPLRIVPKDECQGNT